MKWLRQLLGRRNGEYDAEIVAEQERFLLVGLGNPGRQYAGNRHNIGFMLVDRLAAAHNIELGRVQSRAIVGHGRIAGCPVTLVKPQTYMNRSGDAVGPLARYFKVPAARVLVAYDDMDIPAGTIRLRDEGGAGGHNGMKSIINHLGNDFPRLRLGVGRPPGRMPPPAFLLQDFGAQEAEIVDELLDRGAAAVVSFIGEGVQLAMTRHNGPPAT